MNKKAEIIGQIFVFILAIFVFTMILTFGYQYINKFLNEQKKVEVIDFKNTLEDSFEKIKYLYGDVRKLELRIPSGYEKICFADSENAKNNQRFPLLAHINQIDGQNVFLLPLQELRLKIPNLRSEESICCLKAEQKLILKLEAKKEGVFISPWNEYLKCE